MKSFAIAPLLIASTLAVAQMSNDLSKGIPRHEQIQQEQVYGTHGQEQVQTQDGYDQMSDEQFDYRRQPSIPQPQYQLNQQHYYALQQQQLQEHQQRHHLQNQQPSYAQNIGSNSGIVRRLYSLLPKSGSSFFSLISELVLDGAVIVGVVFLGLLAFNTLEQNKLDDEDEDGRSSMTDNALRLFQMAQQVYSAIDKQQE